MEVADVDSCRSDYGAKEFEIRRVHALSLGVLIVGVRRDPPKSPRADAGPGSGVEPPSGPKPSR